MGLKGITINTPAAEEPHILAEDDAAIYQAVFGGDCVFDIGSRMKAAVLSNNKVRVGDGVICVGGHMARNIYGDYEELVIENGMSGMNRNDFIVAKFTSTGPGGVDTFSLEVKKGTAGITASDPVVTKGNLYEGASLREFPLYRVKIEGLSITAVEQLFTVRKTNEQLQNEVTELIGNIGILNAGGGAAGSSLKWHNIPSGQNLVMGCWATGLYRYSGYSAGAPDDYAGVMLTVGNVGSANDYLKVAFSLMCSVYVMRQDRNGNITATWMKQ